MGKNLSLSLMIIVLLALVNNTHAQDYSLLKNIVPVIGSKGDTLLSPFAGGMNAPQFSTIDLNGDENEDLFVFDRSDHSIQIFIYEEKSIGTSSVHYRWEPEYIKYFPNNLKYWVNLTDINNDGKKDLITCNDNFNLAIAFNIAEKGMPPKFSEFIEPTKVFRDSPIDSSISPVYIPPTDISGVADMDYDGDIDFLVNNTDGSSVTLYRNLSVEKLNRKDTLLLETASLCWGHFQETFNPQDNDYDVEIGLPACNYDSKTAHVGGVLLPLELNGDTLIDLLISDVGVNTVIGMTNGGNRQIARITEKERYFPSKNKTLTTYENQPIDIPYFPGLFYVSTSRKGIKDLLASPNTPNEGEDVNVVWRYINERKASKDTQPDLYPKFELKEKNFLSGDQIDIGTSSTPVLWDYDKDGLNDLIVATGSRFISGVKSFANLQLFKNIGSAEKPILRWMTDTLLNFSGYHPSQKPKYLIPTFGDLDFDGDDDMLLGQNGNGGFVGYWENMGLDENGLPIFMLRNKNIFNLTMGNQLDSAPHLGDFDGDKKLDALVGFSFGRILYYQNTGNKDSLSFKLISSNLGSIRAFNGFDGAVFPYLSDMNGDGTNELCVGRPDGGLIIYKVCESPEDTFPVLKQLFPNLLRGRTRFAVGGWNTNWKKDKKNIDWLIGTQRGGVLHLQIPYPIELPEVEIAECKSAKPPTISYVYSIYPNPLQAGNGNKLQIRYPAKTRFEILNSIGQKIYSSPNSGTGRESSINVQNWCPGIYIFYFETITPNGTVLSKSMKTILEN